MFHSTSWDLQPHVWSQKAHSRIPSKVQLAFSAACSASAWVLTAMCIQLCVLLIFLTQNSILIWPKLSVSGSSSMIIYTGTIQSDLSAVSYISMLLMCSSLDERIKNLLSTQFPASQTSLCVIGQNCRTCMKTLTSTNQLRVGKVCLSLLSVLHPILSACLPQPNRSQRFDLLEKKSRERSIMQL